MEQQQGINRLYWLTNEGNWKLVLERKEELNVNVEARRRLQQHKIDGVKGYSYIHHKYGNGWKSYWYMHYRVGNHHNRSIVEECEVPKPILLMEMLQ